MTCEPASSLQLFGSVRWLTSNGEHTAFQPERRFQLLALLACYDTPVPRSKLASWLWPKHEPANARRNLRKVLLQAHRLCAELPQAPALERLGEQLRWRPATDLRSFLQACAEPDPARAVQTYQPGLLTGLEAGLADDALDWLARQRAQLEERWHAAARRWLDSLRHQPQAQAAAAEQVLACDPLEETALRTLLHACTALGEVTRGLRALQAYGTRLRVELDTAPSPELAALGQTLIPAVGPLLIPHARETLDNAVQAIVLAAMDTVADTSHWPVLLQRLTQATHGLGSLFAGCSFTHPQDGLLFTHGLDTELGKRFIERYQDNPWARAMTHVHHGQAIDQALLVNQRTLQRADFYQEIIRPQGILHNIAVALPVSRPFNCGGVSIAFGGAHAGERAAQAARLLDHLAPYLQRAMVALLRWRRLPHAETLAAGFDRLPGAVLILTSDAQVLFANAHAEALLTAGDGLRLRAGRLATARPADAPGLEMLLAQAAQAPQPLTTLNAHLRLCRSGNQAALDVSVLPMCDSQDRLQLRGRAAVLVLAQEPP